MAAVDTGATVSAINEAVGAVTSVGLAVLAVMVVIHAYKWIRMMVTDSAYAYDPDGFDGEYESSGGSGSYDAEAHSAEWDGEPYTNADFQADNGYDPDEVVHPDEDWHYSDVDYDEKSPGDEGYDEYDAKRAFWR